MAKIYDFNPVELTITNNAVDKLVDADAGAFNSQKVKMEEVDGVLVNTVPAGKKLVSGARTIQLFKINSFVTLMPGDSIKLTALSAAEMAHYENIADDEISVEPAIATEAEEETTSEEVAG